MSDNQIVLTDAPPQPVLLKACPRHPKAPVVASAGFGDPHGVCSKCGFEPLALPKDAA